MRRLSKNRSVALLSDQIKQIDAVKKTSRHSPVFTRWHRDTETAVRYIFGAEARDVAQFRQIRFLPSTPEGEVDGAFLDGMEHARAVLQSMIQEIENFWQDGAPAASVSEEVSQAEPRSKRVFIVHGRDEGLKNTVARILSEGGLEPIILHEKPAEGRTIIEKFEKHSAVSHAVILLTGDDEGKRRNSDEDPKPRARQNVVLELGFFVGRLGRPRVSVLREAGVDIPSDFAGVEYIEVDSTGGWKLRLVRELRDVGLDISVDRAAGAL